MLLSSSSYRRDGYRRRWVWRTLVLSAFAIDGVLPVVNASVQSIDLRTLEDVLVWPSLAKAWDAEALLGPYDLYELRGGAIDPDDVTGRTILNDTGASSSSLRGGDVDRPEKIAFSDKQNLFFSLFQRGDGSEDDPDGIPDRFLRMQNNHRDHAKKALHETLQWREEHNIDEILLQSQRNFDICKEVFPHYFVGRDESQHVVFVQRPPLIDLDKAKKNGLTSDELLMHYVFVNEWLWQIAESDKPLGTMTSVIDLKGLNLGLARRRDILAFLKQFVTTMDSHYPQRAHKTILLNAPRWFNVIYKMISPLLRESTKSKIEIYGNGKKQDKALRAIVGDQTELLPKSFWSKHVTEASSDEESSGDGTGDDEDDDAPAERDDGSLVASELEQDLRNYVRDGLVVDACGCL